jgi:hypothetical protein
MLTLDPTTTKTEELMHHSRKKKSSHEPKNIYLFEMKGHMLNQENYEPGSASMLYLEEHLYEFIVSPKSWLSNTLNKIQIKNI